MIPRRNLWILPAFTLDGVLGLSPICYGANVFSGAMAADRASNQTFSNGMSASGFVAYGRVPAWLTEKQRNQLRGSIQQFTRNGAKAGSVFVLEGGMGYTPLSMNPEDAQMLETRAFNVEEICRWYGVPPTLIGHGDKTSNWGPGWNSRTSRSSRTTCDRGCRRSSSRSGRISSVPGEKTAISPSFPWKGYFARTAPPHRLLLRDGQQRPDVARRSATEGKPPTEGRECRSADGSVCTRSHRQARRKTATSAGAAGRIGSGTRAMKHKHAQLQHKQFAFKADAVNDDGTFTGYGSVFGNVDSYREIVAPGAFAESLKAINDSGDPLPALWQHNADQPIGGYSQLAEDDRGLKVRNFLMVNELPLAKQAHALMQRRIVKGLSIGYYVLADSYDEKERVRTLTKLDLQEISIVTFPANVEAQIDAVKEKLRAGHLPRCRNSRSTCVRQASRRLRLWLSPIMASRSCSESVRRRTGERTGQARPPHSPSSKDKPMNTKYRWAIFAPVAVAMCLLAFDVAAATHSF